MQKKMETTQLDRVIWGYHKVGGAEFQDGLDWNCFIGDCEGYGYTDFGNRASWNPLLLIIIMWCVPLLMGPHATPSNFLDKP